MQRNWIRAAVAALFVLSGFAVSAQAALPPAGSGCKGPACLLSPSRRVGERRGGRRRPCRRLCRVPRAAGQGSRGDRDPRDLRAHRLGPRRGRPAGRGRVHRRGAGLPLGQGAGREGVFRGRARCGAAAHRRARAGRDREPAQCGRLLGHEAASSNAAVCRGRLLLGRRHQLPVRHGAARRSPPRSSTTGFPPPQRPSRASRPRCLACTAGMTRA